MHMWENLLQHLDPYSPDKPWFERHIDDGQRTLPFFYWNFLDDVRYLLDPLASRNDRVHKPLSEYHLSGQKIYPEMYTADW